MILKTVCAFLALVLEIFGVYGDGEFKFHYGYVSNANTSYYLQHIAMCYSSNEITGIHTSR